MEIVINISDELYNYMCSEQPYDKHLDKRFDFQIRNSVKKGTPLPKGHGDLVDASMSYGEWVCTQDGNYECVREGGCENCEYSEYQCYTDIRDLPVIIKADRDKSEVRNADSN